MKHLKPTRPKAPANSLRNQAPLSARFSENERRTIRRRADKFTEGNISEWLRFAALNFTPKPEDFE